MEVELWGVMPTYKRPTQLVLTLAELAQQTRQLDHLVIVDNGGDMRSLLDSEIAHPKAARRVTLLSQDRNLGPAGALDVGLRHVLANARADAWVATFDDDDPPRFPDVLQRLWESAQQTLMDDPRIGAIGVSGTRFESDRVRVRKLHNDELTGRPVRVTALGGNHVPMIRLAAVKEAGPHRAELFFGHEELEFFLRVNQKGWSVYCDTAMLRRYRKAKEGRTGQATVPSWRLGHADWRRYYSIRNRVYVAREYAGLLPACRVVAEVTTKVLANAVRSPRSAIQHARLTASACLDGWVGRLGPTWTPDLTADGRLPLNANKRKNRPSDSCGADS